MDTSGSMGFGSKKIDQLKNAMENILEQLQPGDYVSLIEFNSVVYVWNIENKSQATINVDDYNTPFEHLDVVSNFFLYI